MLKTLRLAAALTALITSYTVSANEDERTALNYNVHASYSWVPYYIPQTPEMPGIVLEIIPQILALANIDGTAKNYPPRRTKYALDKGFLDFDIVSPSWFNEIRTEDDFVFSDPFLPIESYFVTLKKNANKWQGQSQLPAQEEIGTVRGYLYHNDSDFNRSDFHSEKDLIKGLAMGRIQLAIIGKSPAIYWSRELKVPIALTSVHSSGHLVLRLRKDHGNLLPRLNQAIAQLKQQGMIKSIVNKYSAAMPEIDITTE